MKDNCHRYYTALLIAIGLWGSPSMALASESGHLDPVASVIFWVTLLFFFGIIGRYFALKMHQPGVLGEVIMGVLIGNLGYFFNLDMALILREGGAVFHVLQGMLSDLSLPQAVNAAIPNPHYAQPILRALSGGHGIDLIKVAYIVDIFARYGAIFLLFMVGLESSLEALKSTGRQSLQVALIGVVVPIIFGLIVSVLLIPQASFKTALFVAATLSATSVGITARVLQEMKKINTLEARTILGAAMIDDVLGLMILTIVSRLVISGTVSPGLIVDVIFLTLSFFVGVFWLGPYALKMMIRVCSFLSPWEAMLTVSFLFVMVLSWLATVVQLAAIIGAFAAGIMIHDNLFDKHHNRQGGKLLIKELVAPLEAVLAPLFFMLMGIQVKLESFFDGQVVIVAMGLVIAAMLGKLISGMGASRKYDRLLIGIGMMPRGEVGLIFAAIGKSLGVISDSLFAAIVLMVIVTTILTPLWLKSRYKAQQV